MLQSSKIYQSRNNWREKAVERANEIREYRKATERHKKTISELKEDIIMLKEELGTKDIKKSLIKIFQ
jgi:hypothetical protein